MTCCERCGGELGTQCAGTGTADCDLNLTLRADGIAPDHYRNPVSDTWWYRSACGLD